MMVEEWRQRHANDQRIGEFLRDFTDWAGERSDILGVALVGSRARGEAREDSDLDLVVVSSHAAEYLADLSWTSSFGEVERDAVEQYGKLTSVRVWYRDGLEIEFGITDEDWVDLPLDPDTQAVVSDGLVVLLERGDLLSRHQAADRAAGEVPGKVQG